MTEARSRRPGQSQTRHRGPPRYRRYQTPALATSPQYRDIVKLRCRRALLRHTRATHRAERIMRKITPFSCDGTIKSCAGCNQPFVVRKGWSEAIVGHDGRLYCYGRSCEADAMRAHGAVIKLATRKAA